ncbi:hypothetical protein PUN28_012137 [Cardiocondyla obscurior]|uniref:Uncharacterized protein n=1 Tax=Cardiocondyla obscurior TaxID=286306 RepID=A0AAW2FEM7_9HYME
MYRASRCHRAVDRGAEFSGDSRFCLLLHTDRTSRSIDCTLQPRLVPCLLAEQTRDSKLDTTPRTLRTSTHALVRLTDQSRLMKPMLKGPKRGLFGVARRDEKTTSRDWHFHDFRES